MTEMTDTTVQLSPAARRFVLHWGEMGTRWGVNRTVAQAHALLYLSPRPLNAEEIAGALSVARSNVSTSLRELQSWGLVRVVHAMGDRRDHFETMADVWELFRVVMDERLKREVEPTVRVLRECLAEAEREKGGWPGTREKLRAMLGFFETTTACYEQMRRLPAGAISKLARLGPALRRLLGAA
ncbi:MAG: MarR family transcriptional regulator [Phycisphaerales bacterium]